MITLDVADYCSACMDFDPDVQRPQKAYALNEEIIISDTIIRCANRNRCKNIEREEDERFHRLLHTLFYLCELAGFEIEGRIILVDKRNGRIWR